MENRDYKEEYIRTKTNEVYRKYENDTLIRISKAGKTKLNISINPFLKDEFKNICEGTISEEIEKFILNRIEEYHNKKVILKK